MANFPGHSYLGPGNEVRSDEFTPADFDDVIAYFHDQEYKYAHSSAEISAADLTALHQFVYNYLATGNYHSAVGAVGLGVKHLLERIIGRRIYPFQVSMVDAGFGGYEFVSDEINFGRYLYGLREKLAAEIYHERKLSGYSGSYRDFKKLPVWKNILRDFGKGGKYYDMSKHIHDYGGDSRKIFDSAKRDYGISDASSTSSQLAPPPTDSALPTATPTAPTPSTVERKRPAPQTIPEHIQQQQSAKRPSVETQIQTPSTSSAVSASHQATDKKGQALSGGAKKGHHRKRPPAESVASLEKELNAGSGDQTDRGGGDNTASVESTSMEAPPSTGFPTVAGAAGVGGSHSGGAVAKRSAALTSAGFLTIPRSLPFPPMRTTFITNHIFYSYGYANTSIDSSLKKGLKIHTTPLCYIPVDYIPLYLSAAEWQQLPLGTKVTDLHVTVKVLGTRTSFDTGTSISGVATSEYVGIGLVGHGLNLKIPSANFNYSSDATNPMLPTAVNALSESQYVRKFWIDTQSTPHCVPRQMSGYYGIYETDAADLLAGTYTSGTGHGRFRLDKLVDKYVVSTAIGQEIASYHYSPKRGYIRSPLPHVVNDGTVVVTSTAEGSLSGVYYDVNRAYAGMLSGKSTVSRGQLMGDRYTQTVEESKSPNDNHPGDNPQTSNYYYQMRIERVQCYRGNDGKQSTMAQPQLHVGLVAIPQLNPSTETSTYLNACMYFSVECQMDVEINFNSITENIPSCMARDAVFTDNYAGMAKGVNPYGYECKENYFTSVDILRPNGIGTDAVSRTLTNTMPSGPALL